MARVYLETSYFSACVSTRATPKSAGWRATSREWWDSQAGKHDLFISDEVVVELSDAGFPERHEALEMLRGLSLLELTPEVREVATALVREKAMPAPALSGDAIHVAVATVHRMEFVLTWNVRHIANPNKRTHLAAICLRLGLPLPQIVTPDLLQE